MRRILSSLLALTMVCAMSLSANAAVQSPDRIVPGEIENNAVLGGQWLESTTFVPVSTGVGYVTREAGDVNGMTAIITHVNPVFTRKAQGIATKIGGSVVGAFNVRLPVGVTNARVVFDVKDGFTMPANPTFIAVHGETFNTPVSYEKISDKQFAITFYAKDNDFYIINGGSLAYNTTMNTKDYTNQ